jgi:hypothetical protein
LEYNTKYNQTKQLETQARFDNPSFLKKTVNNDLKIGTASTLQSLSTQSLNSSAEGKVLDSLNYLQLSGESQMS